MKVIEKKRAYSVVRNLSLKIPHTSMMKVMDKKRTTSIIKNLSQKTPIKIPQASAITSIIKRIISNRIIWYSASLLLYFWFVYWIAYDIFVWHKPITQGSITNYVGAVLAMAMIWAGTKLPTIIKHTARFFPQKQKNQESQDAPKKEAKPKKRKHTPKTTTQPQQQTPLPKPQQQPLITEQNPNQPEPPQLKLPGCTHHFGYLHQPGKIKNMPDECLTCKKLTKCLTQIQE